MPGRFVLRGEWGPEILDLPSKGRIIVSTVNLKNVSGGPLSLGRAEGRRIEDGEVIHVEGKVAKGSPDDAYLIGDGDDARLYPHSVWKMTSASSKSDPDVVAPSEESA